ncbi:hypothetical protein [Flavobacterium sp.]|uniref:hypothetical protein n=1 Tax=Flavobacterium sp. TaxID=239 RepID=UPI003BE8AC62
MKIDIRKMIVRLIAASLALVIMAYIFWPKSEIIEETIDSTTTTTMQLIVADAPCLVFYQKNKDLTVFAQTACTSTYIEKYIGGYYSKINIVCRSSSDGQTINRNDLSEKRMKALQFNLLERGVLFEDINPTSLGDTSPYPGVDPESEDGKILNRSCEITGILG